MAAVLCEGLGVFRADLFAAHRTLAAHRLKIFIHAVMGTQPVALGFMRCQCFRFLRGLFGDIDPCGQRGRVAIGVDAFDGVAVIEIRHMRAGQQRELRGVGRTKTKTRPACQ